MPAKSSPLPLIAGVVVLVGISAAVPAALFLSSRDARANKDDPRASVAGEPPPAGASSAAPPPSSSTTPSSSVSPSPPVSPSPSPSLSVSVAASASAAPDGPGFLTIVTSPPARVSEHGRTLCTTTPCAKLPLPAGVHTLTLENKDEALKNSLTVTITSGETTARRVTLKP